MKLHLGKPNLAFYHAQASSLLQPTKLDRYLTENFERTFLKILLLSKEKLTKLTPKLSDRDLYCLPYYFNLPL